MNSLKTTSLMLDGSNQDNVQLLWHRLKIHYRVSNSIYIQLICTARSWQTVVNYAGN